MSNRAPFPTVLDSTIVAAFRSCPHKAHLEFFHHWKSKEPSVHLHAGAAYAKGLEAARTAYYLGLEQMPIYVKALDTEGNELPAKLEWKEQPIQAGDVTRSVAIGLRALLAAYGDFECPEDSPKSASRMAGALEFYFDRYPLGQDRAIPMALPGGKRGIEFSFLEPIDLLHPETGDPLLYSGRMDMMVDYENMHLGEDDKTASQLGASWPRQWDLRSQFTGYVWGAARAGIKLDGFLVRGVSILKTKYDTLEAITYRPAWQIERWYAQLLRDAKRMITAWEEGYFDLNLDHACAEYGGCQFRGVCQMKEPEQLLRVQFQRRKWDPVARTEVVLDEEAA